MYASGDRGLNIQSVDLQCLKNIVAHRKRFSELCDKIDRKKFLDVLGRRSNLDSIKKEVKLTLQQLISKVKNLNLVPFVGSSQQSSSTTTPNPRMSIHTKYLLPFHTIYINNKLPLGVELIKCIFIWEPVHDILYLASQNHMCFQRTDDLLGAPTKHLFHLRTECIGHKEFEQGYHVLMSLKLS
ncbi:unnamed protein product [Lactuca saligna]|uniref:Uncharacterized protein n=1 Tax=Lactuca saligna TaxID=75948 RepID=A0AA36E5C7_LACSI|nr:unnamed protein product [Lactuca saligna]